MRTRIVSQTKFSLKLGFAEQEIVEALKDVSGQIQDLSDQFDSYQQSFIDEMTKLADEGERIVNDEIVINDEHVAKARAWIAKANYMIRSLTIPTEAGWLRDTSAVKESLRKAMEGFDKGDAETRMKHAREVLVIVDAIRDLAQGGRIP